MTVTTSEFQSPNPQQYDIHLNVVNPFGLPWCLIFMHGCRPQPCLWATLLFVDWFDIWGCVPLWLPGALQVRETVVLAIVLMLSCHSISIIDWGKLGLFTCSKKWYFCNPPWVGIPWPDTNYVTVMQMRINIFYSQKTFYKHVCITLMRAIISIGVKLYTFPYFGRCSIKIIMQFIGKQVRAMIYNVKILSS